MLSSAFILVPSFRKTAEVSLGAWDSFLLFPFHFSKVYIQMERSICHPPSAGNNISHFQAESSFESCNCAGLDKH